MGNLGTRFQRNHWSHRKSLVELEHFLWILQLWIVVFQAPASSSRWITLRFMQDRYTNTTWERRQAFAVTRILYNDSQNCLPWQLYSHYHKTAHLGSSMEAFRSRHNKILAIELPKRTVSQTRSQNCLTVQFYGVFSVQQDIWTILAWPKTLHNGQDVQFCESKQFWQKF